ncbi:hypothetical protein WJX77_011812 [Trebouxia sp. C0004]
MVPSAVDPAPDLSQRHNRSVLHCNRKHNNMQQLTPGQNHLREQQSRFGSDGGEPEQRKVSSAQSNRRTNGPLKGLGLSCDSWTS